MFILFYVVFIEYTAIKGLYAPSAEILYLILLYWFRIINSWTDIISGRDPMLMFNNMIIIKAFSDLSVINCWY